MYEHSERDKWRAYWRIIFDVINGVPRLQQEITIWAENRLTRYAHDIKELPLTPQGNVTVESNRVVFNNGYYECVIDLETDIRALAANAGLGEGPLEGLAISINGENVSIRADVALFGDPSIPEYPLFFFPQPIAPGIQLIEAIDPGDETRKIKWSVSGQFYVSQLPFTLEQRDARHGVRVRQDRENGAEIFEFLVDSIPVEARFTTPNHQFATSPQIFYIGRTPGHKEGLKGAIAHLEFDPNASCGSCPRPTSEIQDDPF